MQVVFFQRKPRAHGNYSLETLFEDLRERLPTTIESKLVISAYESNSILPRLINIAQACFRQGEVNHVTGDTNFLTLGLRPARTILTIHDCFSAQRLSGLRRWLYIRFFLKWPIQHARFVSVVSQATKDHLHELLDIDLSHMVIIPNAVSDLYQFTPKEFNQAKPRLLQLGVAENKNLPRLIEAIDGINCHLRIIGQPDQLLLNKLETHSVEYSCASNLSQQQILSEYQQADIICFASSSEGFGMPIIEGQAVGRPILTSAIAPMSDVAGRAAEFVDPFKVESIRNGLLNLIDDRERTQSLIEAGRENLLRFDPQEITNRYLDLYKQVFEESRS